MTAKIEVVDAWIGVCYECDVQSDFTCFEPDDMALLSWVQIHDQIVHKKNGANEPSTTV